MNKMNKMKSQKLHSLRGPNDPSFNLSTLASAAPFEAKSLWSVEVDRRKGLGLSYAHQPYSDEHS